MAPGRWVDRYNGGDTTLREGAPMAAVAEHRRLRLDLDCIVRDARASDLPRLEWFGIYAHLRRMEEANYRDVEAGTKLWLVSDVNGFPVGHLKVNLRVDDPSRGNPRGYIFALRVFDPFQGLGIGTELITAAESRGTAKVVATPRVTALNNRKAEISSGQQIPVSLADESVAWVEPGPPPTGLQLIRLTIRRGRASP